MNASQINKEASIITRILQARSIKACVDLTPDKKALFLPTPSTIVYQLRIAETTPIAKVYDLQDDFCSHISRWRLESGIVPDDFQTVVRVDMVAQTVEVNRCDPEAIAFADVLANWQAQSMTALCGLAYTFKRQTPVTWKLCDPDQPHVLIAGTTGSGKTNELMSIIGSLALNNSPADLHFSIIDMKRSRDLRPLDMMPHVQAVAREPADAVKLLRTFHGDMEDRERGKASNRVRHVLIVDELATLTESDIKNDVLPLLNDIGRKCREANMNMVLCTQSPKAKILGDQLKGLLALRLVGAVTSKVEANTAVNMAGSGAEMLPGRGAMIYRCGRTLRRFQAPLVSSPMALVRKARLKWEDVISVSTPVERHVDAIPTPVVEQAAIVQVSSMPVELIPVFRQFTGEDGVMRRGGMAAALRVLFGPNAPASGKRYQMESDKISAWHYEYFTSLHQSKKPSVSAQKVTKQGFSLGEVKYISEGKGILQ